jgi:hypothetical protein
MIIGERHLERVPMRPTKTDPAFVIDTNAVLSHPVTLQDFKTVPRRRHEIAKLFCSVDLNRPSKSN